MLNWNGCAGETRFDDFGLSVASYRSIDWLIGTSWSRVKPINQSMDNVYVGFRPTVKSEDFCLFFQELWSISYRMCLGFCLILFFLKFYSISGGARLELIFFFFFHFSFTVAVALRPITSSTECPQAIHGTYKRFMSAIMSEGLRPMGRQHIHFSQREPTERNDVSGIRRSCDVLIFLNVEKALADGIPLFESANGVILSPGNGNGCVPRAYFLKVIDRTTGAVWSWRDPGKWPVRFPPATNTFFYDWSPEYRTNWRTFFNFLWIYIFFGLFFLCFLRQERLSSLMAVFNIPYLPK